MSSLEQHETLRQLVAGTYAAGLAPLARGTASQWRAVRNQGHDRGALTRSYPALERHGAGLLVG